MKNENRNEGILSITEGSESVFHPHCFACSHTTGDGLQLKFENVGDRVVCRTTIDNRYQGYDGIVHGGIISTLLDATMVLCLHEKFLLSPFTCKLEVHFVKSLPTGKRITIEAVAQRRIRNMCWAKGVIKCDEDIYAEGQGIFRLF